MEDIKINVFGYIDYIFNKSTQRQKRNALILFFFFLHVTLGSKI